MKKSRSTKLMIAAVPTALAAAISLQPAQAQFVLAGDIEADTDIVQNRDGSSEPDFDQGGRIRIAPSATKELGSGHYVKTLAQLLIKLDGTTAVDDVFVRFGSDSWNIRLGRFESMDLFRKGDRVLNVLGDDNFYQANAARGRAGGSVGQVEFNFFPTDSIELQLGTIWGETDDAARAIAVIAGDNPEDETTFAGIRPAVKFKAGGLNLAVGYDYLDDAGIETQGYGISAKYSFSDFAIIGNLAYAEKSVGSTTTAEITSFNINAEYRSFGIGFLSTENDVVANSAAEAVYGHYTFQNFFGSPNTGLTIGLSLSDADFVDETETVVRFRVNHSF